MRGKRCLEVRRGIFCRLFIITAGALILCMPARVSAGPVLGAKASGMATAFTAVADDGSAIVFNPAGLTGLKGFQAYGGVNAVFLSSRYEDPAGDSERTDFKMFLSPFLFLTDDLGRKDMMFGIGLFSPFGIGGRLWSNEGLTRYASTESTMDTYSANIAAAWRITPWLSVAAGPYYLMVKDKVEYMTDQSLLSWSDGRLKLDGEGGGYGYLAGILIEPVKEWSIGISYRSSVKVDMDGTASIGNIAPPLHEIFGGSRFETDVRTDVQFPDVWLAGIAWKPTDKLTVALDGELYRWKTFRSRDLDFEIEVPDAGLTDMSVPLDWKNTWGVFVGFDLKLNREVSLRGGYGHITRAVPDSTFGPSSLEAAQNILSAGIGYRLMSNMTIDVFYLMNVYRTREVDNEVLSGTYDSTSQVGGVGLTYRH